jgi:outer membrane protein assembly factor BamD (BamD/ComL family)
MTRALIVSLLLALLAAPAFAQRAPVTAPIDVEAERASAHNLDVGKQYFKKKAWVGARGRLEEIVATHTTFTKIDEVYYMLGVVYARTDEPDDARDMFQKLLDERPDSPYAKRAREELEKLPASPNQE